MPSTVIPAACSALASRGNTAPVANNQSISTPKDTAVAVTLTASDADGSSLIYVVDNNPANGALSGSAPGLTCTPSSGYVGSDSFKFYASDGTATGTATVSITVGGSGGGGGGTTDCALDPAACGIYPDSHEPNNTSGTASIYPVPSPSSTPGAMHVPQPKAQPANDRATVG